MNYIPFLKLKQNEVLAIRRLKKENKAKIIPFFDIPRGPQDGVDEFKNKISKGLEYIRRAYKDFEFPFYLDVYDIADNIDLDGKHVYEYLLEKFRSFNIIPVVGLDRDAKHIEAAIKFIKSRSNKHLAIRLLDEDIESYDLTESDIRNSLGSILNSSININIIIDLRVIKKDINTLSRMIIDFINEYVKKNRFHKIIVASSSTPANITELIKTQSSKTYARSEWKLWKSISSIKEQLGDDLIYADYAVVSPDYSDTKLPLTLLQSVMTPKAIYTKNDKAFVTRGGRMKSEGYDQYYQMADDIVSLSFFRGRSFCYGDDYIYKISSKECATCGSAQSWIAATINCHISYMLEL